MIAQIVCPSALSRTRSVWTTYAEISRFIRISQPPNHYSRPQSHTVNDKRSFSSTQQQNNLLDQSLRKRLENYKETLKFRPVSHDITDLRHVAAGTEVDLLGYLGPRKDVSKGLSFGLLRGPNLSSDVQIVSTPGTGGAKENGMHNLFKSLVAWTPVSIRGIIKDRRPPKETASTDSRLLKEIELRSIMPLNEFPKDIIAKDETVFPPEQRHLQLRMKEDLRNALRFRENVATILREHLREQSFSEVETPILFKSTPEGAREFLVPTRTKGLAYALPQSPQQYKQTLMSSGIWRYYQFARCFRDEDLRADRQPEFTQLDLEMSFADAEDVMNSMEKMLKSLWLKALNVKTSEVFPRMTYHDAMARYGSDKPDLRFGTEIHRFGHLVPVDLIIKVTPLTKPDVGIMSLRVSDDPSKTREFINKFMDSHEAAPFLSNPDGQPGIFVYDPKKPLSGLQPFGFEAAEQAEELFNLEAGDLVVLQAREDVPFTGGSTAIGNLRLALFRSAVAQGYIETPHGFQFVWITDFPMFSPSNDIDPGQGGAAGLSATHHPFTSPNTPGDVDLLLTDPTAAKAAHYDIVVNGVELGGGSRRIHNAEVQEFVLRDVLKMSDDRLLDFSHLLEVLRAGCPPHAGIALGFDRLIAVMLGKDSVRDVIAFPKSGRGEDLLVQSPNAPTKEQWETYHLQLKD